MKHLCPCAIRQRLRNYLERNDLTINRAIAQGVDLGASYNGLQALLQGRPGREDALRKIDAALDRLGEPTADVPLPDEPDEDITIPPPILPPKRGRWCS